MTGGGGQIGTQDKVQDLLKKNMESPTIGPDWLPDRDVYTRSPSVCSTD